MKIGKSLLSILGSYVLSIVLVMATDPLLGVLFPNDYKRGQTLPDWLLWVSTALFAVISVVCAWVCAKLAPSKVRMHVLAFFALGEILGGVTTALSWGKMPHWYTIAWLIVWIPAVWIGWKLADRSISEQ